MRKANISSLRIFREAYPKSTSLVLWPLLALAALNPPAFLLAQNRPVKIERIGLALGFLVKQVSDLDFHH